MITDPDLKILADGGSLEPPTFSALLDRTAMTPVHHEIYWSSGMQGERVCIPGAGSRQRIADMMSGKAGP